MQTPNVATNEANNDAGNAEKSGTESDAGNESAGNEYAENGAGDAAFNTLSVPASSCRSTIFLP